MKVEIIAPVALALVAGMVASPVVGLVGSMLWFTVSEVGESAIIFFAIAGLAFALTFWKTLPLFRKIVRRAQKQVAEPMFSAVTMGVLGAFLVSGCLLAGILFLGHARPVSWDFGNIPIAVGLGFFLSLPIGFAVGTRRRKIQAQSAQRAPNVERG